ncbi:hypothetical protein JTE90_012964, partial [Oedothorax gibbosus]
MIQFSFRELALALRLQTDRELGQDPQRRPCSPPVACPCPPPAPPSLPSPPHEEREGGGRPREEQVRIPARSPGEGTRTERAGEASGGRTLPCGRPDVLDPPPPSDHQMAFMPDTVARRGGGWSRNREAVPQWGS